MRNIYIAAVLGLLIILGSVVYAKKRMLPVVDTTAVTTGTSTQELPPTNLPLKNTEWVWLQTELPNDDMISTPEREKYVLVLDDTARIQSSTDCNTFIGKYVVNGEVLSIGPLTSTKKACVGSIESTYAKELSLVNSFTVMGNRLYLNLNRDTGRMVFEQK